MSGETGPPIKTPKAKKNIYIYIFVIAVCGYQPAHHWQEAAAGSVPHHPAHPLHLLCGYGRDFYYE